METTSSRPSSQAPQRRNRGTRMSTAPSISPMPRASVPGSVSAEATRNSDRAWDQTNGSVSFQAPETKNGIARSTAQTPPMAFFQAGKSRLAIPRPKSAGFAVVSDICPILPKSGGARRAGDGRVGGEELAGNLHSPANVGFAVRGREESSLELGGRQIDSPVQHPVEKPAETHGIGALGRFPVRHGLGREEKREHRSHAVHGDPGWRD